MNKKSSRHRGKSSTSRPTKPEHHKPQHQQGNAGHKTGSIRIIAGAHRGRKLPVHDVAGLRPTTDRVKETVFNWLMQQVQGSHCLDCFAGSGSLAFEALSRGAKSVTLVEKDPLAASQIEQNLALLAIDNAQLIKGDCLGFLGTLTLDQAGGFDLVFIDPPFRQNLANPVCQLLEERKLLNPSALIYVEVENELNDFTPPPQWQLLKEKVAGQVSFRLYQR
ncbi:MAG: 16S rRNA (guanine966-N2)-methyltransferase [Phenylobacterium sp.]|jgi:16S rRNA (guanine966-N2)-methyltransferase